MHASLCPNPNSCHLCLKLPERLLTFPLHFDPSFNHWWWGPQENRAPSAALPPLPPPGLPRSLGDAPIPTGTHLNASVTSLPAHPAQHPSWHCPRRGEGIVCLEQKSGLLHARLQGAFLVSVTQLILDFGGRESPGATPLWKYFFQTSTLL